MSPPDHPRRRYRVHTHQPDELLQHADDYLEGVPVIEGSWWPEWLGWLRERSGNRRKPPVMGAPEQGYAPRDDAPGALRAPQIAGSPPGAGPRPAGSAGRRRPVSARRRSCAAGARR